MASITGKAGAVTIAAAGVTGKVREWSLELDAKTVDDTAMGDTWQSQVGLTNSWKASFTAIMPTGSGADFYPASLGTDVAITLKRVSADTNPVFSGTGILKSIRLRAPAEDLMTYELTVECSAGTAPTFDTTPTA